MNDDTSSKVEECHTERSEESNKKIIKSFELALSNRKILITGFFAGSE
jgi:hypothetical protein